MSAEYHGTTTFRCYDDCEQRGCPSHHIRVVSKHGGYYVEYLDAGGKPITGQRQDLGDIGLIDAVTRVLRD